VVGHAGLRRGKRRHARPRPLRRHGKAAVAAALAPPALRAICPWEGFTDVYRDLAFSGGIREKGFLSVWALNIRRCTRQSYNLLRVENAHPLRDDFWLSLVPELSAIRMPMLVCGSFQARTATLSLGSARKPSGHWHAPAGGRCT